MKLLRFASVVVALVAAIITVASLATVQTAIARHFLFRPAFLHSEVGRVALGLQRLEVEHLQLARDGWTLTVPSASLDASLWRFARKDLHIRRLVAHGWTLDFSHASDQVATALNEGHVFASLPLATLGLAQIGTPVSTITNTEAAAAVFRGIFPLLDLPVDLAVDDVNLEGDLIFRSETGGPIERIHITITGGGLGLQQVGRFAVTGEAMVKTSSAMTRKVAARTMIQARLATSRRLDQILLESQISAERPQASNGPHLFLKSRVERVAEHENYSFVLQSLESNASKTLAEARAEFPDAKGRLSGTWTLDARDGDLVPFALGFRFPTFAMKGRGDFDAEGTFEELHTSGAFEGKVAGWDVFSPKLKAIGELNVHAEFDLFQQGRLLRVSRFGAGVAAAQPIFSIEVLQGIEVNAGTGELKVADPRSDLVRMMLSGVPVSWLQPFLSQIDLSGGGIHGALVGQARRGGFVLRSTQNLSVTGLTLSKKNRSWLKDVELGFALEAFYGPDGWQADVSDLTLRSGETPFLSASAKIGQTSEAESALKAKGHYQLLLPASVGQPFFQRFAGLDGGVAEGDVSAVLTSALRQFAANLELRNLHPVGVRSLLPTVSVLVRADLQTDGLVKLQIPFHVQRTPQPSDGQLDAEVRAQNADLSFDAQLKSDQISVEDIGGLVAILNTDARTSPETSTVVATGVRPLSPSPVPPQPVSAQPVARAPLVVVPPWHGLTGKLRVDLKKLFYASQLQASEMTGVFQMKPNELTFDPLEALLPGGGKALLHGGLSLETSFDKPYAFNGEMDVSHINPAPYLVLLTPDRAPTVDGNFDLEAKFSAHAASLEGLSDELSEEIKLTSRGGKFRGFAASSRAVDLEKFQKTASTVGAILQVAAGMVGYGEGVSYSEKIRAAGEGLRRFSEIDFDQLNIELTHQPGEEMKIADVSLISPEIRFMGNGTIAMTESSNWFERPLHLQVAVGVRGKQADDLKKLGLVGSQKDPLGYVPLLDQFPIDGSVSDLTTDALTRLLNRALSK